MEIREVGADGSLLPGVVVSPSKRVTPATRAGSSAAFGAKTIGFWSSCCLNLNNVMGAAIVALPLVNQQAGWITPTFCILFVFIVSSFAATMLVEAMQRIPGNSSFDQRWEFCSIVGHYFGARSEFAASILYNISLQSTNIASMIVSAQILDVFIVYTCGRSVAFDYHAWPPRLIMSEPSLSDPWLTQYAPFWLRCHASVGRCCSVDCGRKPLLSLF